MLETKSSSAFKLFVKLEVLRNPEIAAKVLHLRWCGFWKPSARRKMLKKKDYYKIIEKFLRTSQAQNQS